MPWARGAPYCSAYLRAADTGDALVSRTVVDLVAGSGLRFIDRGAYRLADGVHDWHVYAVAHDRTSDATIAVPGIVDVDRAVACLA